MKVVAEHAIRAALLALFSCSIAHAQQQIQISTANGVCTWPVGQATQDTAGALNATLAIGQVPTGAGCGGGGTTPTGQRIVIGTSNGTCTYPVSGVSMDTANPAVLHAALRTGQLASGTGCGASGGGACHFTAALAPASTTRSNAGGSVSWMYTVANATTCSGTISPSAGTLFTTSFCNSASACASAQSVSASFPANTGSTDKVYTVTVNCTGTGSASSSSTVTVSHKSNTCPAISDGFGGTFTQWTGVQQGNYFGGGYHDVDVTSFDSVYLDNPWPGSPAITADLALPTDKYLAEHFHVPANFFASRGTVYGNYSINGSGFSAQISMTISTTCGDFSNPTPANNGSTVVPGCWVNKHGPYTPAPLQWRSDTTCVLLDDTDYYLNIINADIGGVLPSGAGSASSTANAQCSGACSDPVSDGPDSGL